MIVPIDLGKALESLFLIGKKIKTAWYIDNLNYNLIDKDLHFQSTILRDHVIRSNSGLIKTVNNINGKDPNILEAIDLINSNPRNNYILRFKSYTVLLTCMYSINPECLHLAMNRSNPHPIFICDVSVKTMPLKRVTPEIILPLEGMLLTECQEVRQLIELAATKSLDEFICESYLSDIVHMFRIMVMLLHKTTNPEKHVNAVGLSFNDNVESKLEHEFYGITMSNLALKDIFCRSMNGFLESFIRDRFCHKRFELFYTPSDPSNNVVECMFFECTMQKYTNQIANSGIISPLELETKADENLDVDAEQSEYDQCTEPMIATDYPSFLEQLFTLENIKFVKDFFAVMKAANDTEEWACRVVKNMIKGRVDPLIRVRFDDNSHTSKSGDILKECSFTFFRQSGKHCYFRFFKKIGLQLKELFSLLYDYHQHHCPQRGDPWYYKLQAGLLDLKEIVDLVNFGYDEDRIHQSVVITYKVTDLIAQTLLLSPLERKAAVYASQCAQSVQPPNIPPKATNCDYFFPDNFIQEIDSCWEDSNKMSSNSNYVVQQNSSNQKLSLLKADCPSFLYGEKYLGSAPEEGIRSYEFIRFKRAELKNYVVHGAW